MNALIGAVWLMLGVIGVIPVANGNFAAGQFWLLFGAASSGIYCWWRFVVFCLCEEAAHYHAHMAEAALRASRWKAFLSIVPLAFICLGIVDKGMSLFGEWAANFSVFVVGVCQFGSGTRLLRQAMRTHRLRHPS